MKKIGLTGGSGSGKSRISAILREHGAEIFDCDAIYKQMLCSDAEMNSAIDTAFPGVYRNGCLDRKLLAKCVFGDAGKLALLNEITHPRVVRELEKRIAASNANYAVIEAIGLIESGIAGICDLLVAVTADREIRVCRIMDRDGLERNAAEERLNAQKSDEFFKKHCDVCIVNNGGEDELRRKVKEIIALAEKNKTEKG